MMDDIRDQEVIDLSLVAWERRYGDLTVLGTWVLGTGRPCLALVATSKWQRWPRSREGLIPCLVPVDHAWRWDDHIGDPTHIARVTFDFAAGMGFDPMDPVRCMRIAMAISDSLGDLLSMGPMPSSEKRTVADILMIDQDTGKTREAEVRGV